MISLENSNPTSMTKSKPKKEIASFKFVQLQQQQKLKTRNAHSF